MFPEDHHHHHHQQQQEQQPHAQSTDSYNNQSTQSLYTSATTSNIITNYPNLYHHIPASNYPSWFPAAATDNSSPADASATNRIQQQLPLLSNSDPLQLLHQSTVPPPAPTIPSLLNSPHLISLHNMLNSGSTAPDSGQSVMPRSITMDQLYNSDQYLYRSGQQLMSMDARRLYDNLQNTPTNHQLQYLSQGNAGALISRSHLEKLKRSSSYVAGSASDQSMMLGSTPAPAAAPTQFESTEPTCTPRPRWCPTQEQIQILESIFNSGTTTPSRDMIVDIAAQLRKYGNIAEANVFYWFQNRKARAKRKLQSPATGATTTTTTGASISSSSTAAPVPARSNNSDDRSPSDQQNSSSSNLSAGNEVQSNYNKSRRISLKPSSPSPSPPSLQESISNLSNTSTTANTTQLLHQESLIMANRETSTNNPSNIEAESQTLIWPQQAAQFGIMEGTTLNKMGTTDSSSGNMSYQLYMQGLRRPSSSNIPNLLDSRVSLSLAPPAQTTANMNITSSTTDHHHHHHHHQQHHHQQQQEQFLQANTKGPSLVMQQPCDSSSREFNAVFADTTTSTNSGLNPSPSFFEATTQPLAYSNRTLNDQASSRMYSDQLSHLRHDLELWEGLDSSSSIGWDGHNQP